MEGMTEPGMVVEAARISEESYPWDVDEILNQNGRMYDFTDLSCQYQGRNGYEGNGYVGRIDRYDCPEENAFLTVLAARPKDDPQVVVVVEVQLPKEDQGKEEDILSSVEVTGDLLP